MVSRRDFVRIATLAGAAVGMSATTVSQIVEAAAKGLKPSIRIFGVEAAMYPSFTAKRRGEAPKCGGQTIAEAVKEIGQVVESVDTVDEVMRLADRHGIELPISELVQRVLHQEITPAEGLKIILSREAGADRDDPTRANELGLQVLHWAEPQEQAILMSRTAEWGFALGGDGSLLRRHHG